MSTVKLFYFAGVRETYKDIPSEVVGLAFEFEGTWFHYGRSDKTEDSTYGNFSDLLTTALIKITELVPDYKELVLVPSPTCRSETCTDLIERIFNTENDYKGVIESLKSNKKMKPRIKDGLVGIAVQLDILSVANVTTTSSFKDTVETITGSLQADSAGAKAYYRTVKGLPSPIEMEITPKDLKGKTKDVPNLLTDNIIFNWLGDTRLPEGTLPANVYYTGNGELENKKPKGVTEDKVQKQSNVYFTGNNKRLRVLGKLSAEDRYNVMILKEPNAYMEGVFNYQREVCKGLYSTEQMVAYRRRELFSPGTSNYIDDGNFDVLGHSIHGDIFTLNCPRKDLSYVFNPPRLAFKIKRELEQNQTRLLAHIHGKAESSNMAVTDLTDVFYNEVDGKLKLNPDFTSKTKFFKLDNIKLPEVDKVISIKALVKYDLPERNFLNKLVKDNPKVELLTWMIDQYTVSYAFVITTDEGWLFYHAQYGSRFLLRGASAAARKELNTLKS